MPMGQTIAGSFFLSPKLCIEISARHESEHCTITISDIKADCDSGKVCEDHDVRRAENRVEEDTNLAP
jgi:hypothetical protein